MYAPKLSVPFNTVTESSLDGFIAASPSTAPPSFIMSVCLPFCASEASIVTFNLLSDPAREASVPEYECAEELVNVRFTVALCALLI